VGGFTTGAGGDIDDFDVDTCSGAGAAGVDRPFGGGLTMREKSSRLFFILRIMERRAVVGAGAAGEGLREPDAFDTEVGLENESG